MLHVKYFQRVYKHCVTREECISFLGGKCARCSFTDKRALQIDHVYGGGIKEFRVSSNILRNVIEDVTGKYQLLCANCNWIKRCENNEYGPARTTQTTISRVIYKSTLKSQSKYKRLEIIELLGGKCVRCDFIDIRALQIDHVHGGGNKIRNQLSWWKIYKLVINDKTGSYQLLCANCNWIKRVENKEYNHKKEQIKCRTGWEQIDNRNQVIVKRKLANPSLSVEILALEYALTVQQIYNILRRYIHKENYCYSK